MDKPGGGAAWTNLAAGINWDHTTIGEATLQTLRLTLLAAMTALPLGARAAVTEDSFQLRSAADLAALCSAQPTERLYSVARNFCEGFALGVYRTLVVQEAAGGVKTFCMPTPMPTRDEAASAYVTYMAGSDAPATGTAEDSVLSFLQHQYPCGGKK
jgi:hypothetical protein